MAKSTDQSNKSLSIPFGCVDEPFLFTPRPDRIRLVVLDGSRQSVMSIASDVRSDTRGSSAFERRLAGRLRDHAVDSSGKLVELSINDDRRSRAGAGHSRARIGSLDGR